MIIDCLLVCMVPLLLDCAFDYTAFRCGIHITDFLLFEHLFIFSFLFY